MQTYDITNFMQWFVDQVIRIFTWCFTLLDSIQFAGTSVLGVLIGITILGIGIPIVLTIGKNINRFAITGSERRINKENDNK